MVLAKEEEGRTDESVIDVEKVLENLREKGKGKTWCAREHVCACEQNIMEELVEHL